jgi:hypothetical protein
VNDLFLGREFQGIESVTIAKIDATANGWPDVVDVTGYPTLYLFPANQKDKPSTSPSLVLYPSISNPTKAHFI